MKTWHTTKTGNHQGLVIEDETGRDVAVTYDKDDAPIVAAAPTMYEALKNLENDDGSIPTHAWKMVKAAIAKAEGNQ